MKGFFKRYLVGARVLKTALAVTLSIFIAQQLGFDRATVAALVALLTVQRNFYHSLVQSISKLTSVLIGALLGTAFSYFFGESPLTYGLVTIAAIYICLRLNWQDHIILTAVTAITVIFSETDMPLTFSLEHTITALLGAVIALGVNFLFTPNHRQEVREILGQTEASLQIAIETIIRGIEEPGYKDPKFDQEISKLYSLIDEGMETAKLFREEQRFNIKGETDSDRYRLAFYICKSQVDRLEEMHTLAGRMPVKSPYADPLIRLFQIVKKLQFRRLYGQQGHYSIIESLLEKLEKSFVDIELPGSQDQFISQASLFHLFQEIKRYYRRMQNMPEGLLAKSSRS